MVRFKEESKIHLNNHRHKYIHIYVYREVMIEP